MGRTARALRKRAEKAALKEMRTTELKEIASRDRKATMGDVQDAIEFAFEQFEAHRRARTLRGRLVALYQRWRCRRELVRVQQAIQTPLAAGDATASTEE